MASKVIIISLLLIITVFSIFYYCDPFSEESPLPGKWEIETTYKIIDISTNDIIEKLFGIGDIYIAFNDQTNTFTGLGWISRGEEFKNYHEARLDTLNRTFLCFEIFSGSLDPSPTEKRWKVTTRTIHRTSLIPSKECNFSSIDCDITFPINIDTLNWKGSGTCEKDSRIKIEMEINLSRNSNK